MSRTLLVSAAALLVACSSGPSGPGSISVALSAPAPAAASAPGAALPDVDAIWVNVTAVRAHSDVEGWVTLDTTPARIDVLALDEHSVDLGLASLPPGKVTQLRLLVAMEGNAVVKGGVEFPLVVPSGYQSGIKIGGPWLIEDCTDTVVTLELDGHRSVWAHATGAGEEWILRPVIRASLVVQEPGTCEPGPACDPAACPSGKCDASGDSCAPGGSGATCAEDADCLSGSCVELACAPGGEGAPCEADADCASGSCVEDVCGP